MKKGINIVFITLLCISGMILVTSCSTPKVTASSSSMESENSLEIPNPIVEYTSLEEAETGTGIPLSINADLLNMYQYHNISGIPEDLIQVKIYDNRGDTESNKELLIRKGVGTQDISGDYDIYDSSIEVQIDNISVTCKGTGETFNLAIWNDGEYSYSVSMSSNKDLLDSDEKTGITQSDMEAIVKSVIDSNKSEE